ncbi:MAG: sigma-70 family RNA polymerase sigma factor [Candidatus Aminicenantes bacterium]|nr:sigma-70 family RNA polymerase sigma factor [Candidatus Aminicenantes bacterium]
MYEDKNIVERTLSGEKEAFELIVQKYENPMFNYIGRMVGNRELALELTQEVFLKSYASLHSYQAKYKFSTWLFKIASNLIIDYWRKKKIPTLSLDQQDTRGYQRVPLQISDKEPSIIKKFELSELRERIEKILEEIPPSLREMFVWRHINELSYDEIAEIKGMPVGTVKNRVFQAKEIILQILEEKS